ncbi:DUF1707 and DUF2154 domain-containing protein [Actinomadura graeca]|uniref:DUF1707 and DUF2154 domain-containing protein n=1 Tax=Actinomadura graeca TaxID=2750812 RepID=A0ABX8R2W0_9ACTN|nr:DUF1707 and DUF2154 domain-containing protein [Actinomadura graeca]
MNLPEQPPGSPPSARLRASDADRDQVADRLREALAEGRITPEEHAERIDAVYSAKTYADLEPVLSDLPGQDAPRPRVDLRKEAPLPPPPPQSSTLAAVFSGVERKGRWLVEEHTTVACVFGGADLDFRQAVLSRREVTVTITCLFGGVNIIVPPGVRVMSSLFAVFGGTDTPEDDVLDPEAPVIRLTGMLAFGGVSVERREAGESRRRRDRHGSARERHLEGHERHLERHEEHMRLREEHLRHREERRDRRRDLRAERRRDH